MSAVETFARVGMLSKGFVYGLMGIIALKVAFFSGEVEGKKGALRALASQPFGQWILGALALGFLGYALWRLSQALFNTAHEPDSWKGRFKRLSYLFRSVAYSSLSFSTFRILRDGVETSDSVKSWTATLMNQPFGPALVVVLGLVVIAVGCYQCYKVVSEKYQEDLQLSKLQDNIRELFCKIAPIGIVARGGVFAMMGAFIIQAGLSSQPNNARGFGDALAYLSSQPYGPYLLSSAASGLIIYAGFEMFKARYLRVS